MENFPALREGIIEDQDLIYCQVATLARYANECSVPGRLGELERIMSFFTATISKVDQELENALYVSFLEHLDFVGFSVPEIKKYLPSPYFEERKQLRKAMGYDS